MAQKKKTKATIVSQKQIAVQIYDMWLETELAKDAQAGKFVGVYPHHESTLLPRPISICEADKDKGRLRLVYRVAGKGTAEFAGYREGDTLDILGVLGNGFPLDQAKGKSVFLIGGGIGIPPMLELAKALKAERANLERQSGQKHGSGSPCADNPVKIILGYRNNELFLYEDLEKYGNVYVATEDGSAGTKGNVMDAVKANGLCADVIMACGPMPMLRAIKKYAGEHGIKAYISLEERMACGVGACLGCVCKTKETDHHSHVNNARICTDGPVFEAGEVEI